MRIFDNEGLKLAKLQAEIFEKTVDIFDCSTPIFIRRFINSNILRKLDKNSMSVIDFTVDDALMLINEEFGDSNYGNNKFSKDELYWIGYIYRYLSYTRNISTSFLFRIFDYKKVREMFIVYHTQDLEYTVSSLLELNGLTEEIFDPNSRLKNVIEREWEKKF